MARDILPMTITVAVIAAGAMGAAVGRKLTDAGCTVLTNLDGRSEATRQRARSAGMKDTPFPIIIRQARFVLSILPPSDGYSLAEKLLQESALSGDIASNPLVFVDCNAVNPVTVKRIAGLFSGSRIRFIDACIIGGPPTTDYNPTFYASAGENDGHTLDNFVGFSEYGLGIIPLRGEGTGVGSASALKMSYAVGRLFFHIPRHVFLLFATTGYHKGDHWFVHYYDTRFAYAGIGSL